MTGDFDFDQGLTSWFMEYLERLGTDGYDCIMVIGGGVFGSDPRVGVHLPSRHLQGELSSLYQKGPRHQGRPFRCYGYDMIYAIMI